MIGVISKQNEREVVEEFFQLFKTPWEFYNPDRLHYEVLIATDGSIPEANASLIVIYGAEKSRLDVCELAEARLQGSDAFVERDDIWLPIYRKAVTFSNPDRPILFCGKSRAPIGYEIRKGEQRIIRIGYNLFDEVFYLLSEGQPRENALFPTLDLHISMLRNWIVETGVSLVEIPPVPAGYRFIACLTHDIDFVGIRRHFLDHSMGGFLYRATVGSLINVMRRRTSLRELIENWRAVCSLPLVFSGMCKDPWDQFDRCLEIEDGIPSTFFFVPYKNRPGEGFNKKQGKYRGTKYDVGDARDIIQKVLGHGCEVGVHGIDAYHSIDKGKEELKRIREQLATQDGIGIRIHWLCQNERTFEILDEAGYSYDSTFGYNETVGFKAGTAQVFKPISANTLLEIPLHIQDMALFGRGGMNTSEAHAGELCQQIIDHVNRHSGVLTILWHQRSLGPERLWHNFYTRLITQLKKENIWFATANDIAQWFRMRRSAGFATEKSSTGEVQITLGRMMKTSVPNLVLRSYNHKNSSVFETYPVATQQRHESPLLPTNVTFVSKPAIDN
jgi:peptidoglycan/xylan/chitin deacetylase (PgdA/CDA1 family)